MPYVDSNGVRIHYHLEGDGPALVLQHGFTSSLQNWYAYGYVDALKGDYRLILIDARGHGLSDKPHNADQYELDLRVADVTSVLDDLGVEKAHYLGYSMGGRIGFGIAKYAPHRVHSLTIGGMHPYESGGNWSVEARVDLLRQGMEAYVASLESGGEPVDPARRARLLANDAEALIAAISAPRGGIEDVLPTMAMPCLLYVGEADGFYDGAKECARQIPDATFVSFPGLDHGQTSQASGPLLPHLTEFLNRVAPQASPAD